MKVERALTKQIATTANIVNSLSGGTVFPTLKKTTEEDHYRLEISVPSVNIDDLKVEVAGSDLMIIQKIHVDAYVLPHVLGHLQISADVALAEIHATYEDKLLVIILPFNETSGDYRKDIDIYRH